MKPARVAAPPGVATAMAPDDPLPTSALIVVAFTTVNVAAAVPPKLTDCTLVKLEPVMVTMPPLVAAAGLKELMTGAGMKVNPLAVSDPPGVVTIRSPDAPVPITAAMLVAELTVKDPAFTPPKRTAVAPVNPVPEIVNVAPVAPLEGVNEVITGGGI